MILIKNSNKVLKYYVGMIVVGKALQEHRITGKFIKCFKIRSTIIIKLHIDEFKKCTCLNNSQL